MNKIKKGIEQAAEYWDRKSSTASSNSESVEQNSRPQKMRFELFVSNHDLDKCSLLDVGCGTGDFLYHLMKHDLNVSYTGTDISEKMIESCTARFPENNFLHIDINEISESDKFDFVVSFGVYNIKTDSAWDILKTYTEQQFSLCNKAAHISILTDRYSGFDPHIQSWRAEEVLKMALEITPYVSIRHDYLPNDFSITLYREPLIDTQKGLLLDYE